MQDTNFQNPSILNTKSLILVALFSALVCVGAFIKIPSPLVPFTMQWFFVSMAGLILGAKLGFTSVGVYILLGLMGLPVFTQGGGIGYIFSPTFGYIVGFAIAAFVIGKLTEHHKNSFTSFFLANIIGLLFVYSFGFVHLYFISTVVAGKSVALFSLLKAAVLIFIPTDLLSAALSAKIASRIPKKYTAIK